MNHALEPPPQCTLTFEVSLKDAYRMSCMKSRQAIQAWLITLNLLVIRAALPIRKRLDYARTLRELNDLDDRTLRDLGIWHNDFKAIAKGTYLPDAGRHE